MGRSPIPRIPPPPTPEQMIEALKDEYSLGRIELDEFERLVGRWLEKASG